MTPRDAWFEEWEAGLPKQFPMEGYRGRNPLLDQTRGYKIRCDKKHKGEKTHKSTQGRRAASLIAVPYVTPIMIWLGAEAELKARSLKASTSLTLLACQLTVPQITCLCKSCTLHVLSWHRAAQWVSTDPRREKKQT